VVRQYVLPRGGLRAWPRVLAGLRLYSRVAVDGVELVALRVCEVDEFCDRVRLPGDFVAVHLGLEKEALGCLVGLQQRAVRLTEDLVAQVIELAVREPGLAVGRRIDGANGVARPQGLHAERLGVDIHVMLADGSPVRNLTEAVQNAHLEVEAVVAAPLASGFACLSEEERELFESALQSEKAK